MVHPTGCFRLCILTCILRLHGSSGESARSLVSRISCLFSAADCGTAITAVRLLVGLRPSHIAQQED